MKKLLGSVIAILSLGMMNVYAADESFQASIRILTALSITEQSALSFPDTEASASAQNVVIAPTGTGAAVFNIAGEASRPVTASIVQSNLQITNGSTTVTIGSFTFGGGLSSSGTGTLNGSGQLTGAGVGATAAIPANPQAGVYSGSLTFRVVYN